MAPVQSCFACLGVCRALILAMDWPYEERAATSWQCVVPSHAPVAGQARPTATLLCSRNKHRRDILHRNYLSGLALRLHHTRPRSSSFFPVYAVTRPQNERALSYERQWGDECASGQSCQ
jgi:hypothetical protein